MESQTRHQTHALAPLAERAETLEFFQAVRLIKRYLADSNSPAHLQITSQAALHFADSDVSQIQLPTRTGQQHIELLQSFIGLTGQNGVLPDHYTELLLERLDAKDPTLQHFLGLFNHRLAELFYQAWKTARFFVDYEQQPHAAIENNPLLRLVAGLAGLPRYQQRQGCDDAHLFYAGLLAKQTRPAEGLRLILQDYFNVPISLSHYTGQWIQLNQLDMTRLSGTQSKKDNNRLGVDCLLGQRVWHTQNHFEIQIGPLNYQQYCRLLPNGDMLKALKKLAQFYVGDEYTFSTSLLLRADAIPKCVIRHKRAFRLGWNSWLKTPRQPRDIITARFGESKLYQLAS